MAAFAWALAASSPAQADRPDHTGEEAEATDRLLDIEAKPRGPSWSERIADAMSEAGDELGDHLRVLSGESVDMAVDGRKRTASLRMRAGSPGNVSVGVASDVKFSHGKARVAARVHLAVFGKSVDWTLPEFELVPRSYQGNRYVELRVPVFDLKF